MIDALSNLEKSPILQEYIKSNIDLFLDTEKSKTTASDSSFLNSKQLQVIENAISSNDIFFNTRASRNWQNYHSISLNKITL